jgi:hypothetical protein
LIFDCNLTIHLPLISASTCYWRKSSALKKSLSTSSLDSSTEEEDATPEQRTNHQLRCRIQHLEHDLRDTTTRCSAERECRMSLEALIGGKIFILI